MGGRCTSFVHGWVLSLVYAREGILLHWRVLFVVCAEGLVHDHQKSCMQPPQTSPCHPSPYQILVVPSFLKPPYLCSHSRVMASLIERTEFESAQKLVSQRGQYGNAYADLLEEHAHSPGAMRPLAHLSACALTSYEEDADEGSKEKLEMVLHWGVKALGVMPPQEGATAEETALQAAVHCCMAHACLYSHGALWQSASLLPSNLVLACLPHVRTLLQNALNVNVAECVLCTMDALGVVAVRQDIAPHVGHFSDFVPLVAGLLQKPAQCRNRNVAPATAPSSDPNANPTQAHACNSNAVVGASARTTGAPDACPCGNAGSSPAKHSDAPSMREGSSAPQTSPSTGPDAPSTECDDPSTAADPGPDPAPRPDPSTDADPAPAPAPASAPRHDPSTDADPAPAPASVPRPDPEPDPGPPPTIAGATAANANADLTVTTDPDRNHQPDSVPDPTPSPTPAPGPAPPPNAAAAPAPTPDAKGPAPAPARTAPARHAPAPNAPTLRGSALRSLWPCPKPATRHERRASGEPNAPEATGTQVPRRHSGDAGTQRLHGSALRTLWPRAIPALHAPNAAHLQPRPNANLNPTRCGNCIADWLESAALEVLINWTVSSRWAQELLEEEGFVATLLTCRHLHAFKLLAHLMIHATPAQSARLDPGRALTALAQNITDHCLGPTRNEPAAAAYAAVIEVLPRFAKGAAEAPRRALFRALFELFFKYKGALGPPWVRRVYPHVVYLWLWQYDPAPSKVLQPAELHALIMQRADKAPKREKMWLTGLLAHTLDDVGLRRRQLAAADFFFVPGALSAEQRHWLRRNGVLSALRAPAGAGGQAPRRGSRRCSLFPKEPEPVGQCANEHCQTRRSRSLQLCQGCRTLSYCGDECQRLHWNEHKAQCAAVQSIRMGKGGGGKVPGGGGKVPQPRYLH